MKINGIICSNLSDAKRNTERFAKVPAVLRQMRAEGRDPPRRESTIKDDTHRTAHQRAGPEPTDDYTLRKYCDLSRIGLMIIEVKNSVNDLGLESAIETFKDELASMQQKRVNHNV